MNKQILEIHSQWEDIIQGDLGLADSRAEDVIMSWTASYSDGYEIDLKLVNGADDHAPWAELVLFDPDGNETGCSDVSDTLIGEWSIDGHELITKIKRDEDD